MNTVASWPSLDEAKLRVLDVQAKFHRWAQSDSTSTFPDVFNLVYDRATLIVAWQRVRSNRGSRTAGIDGMTAHYVEHRLGVERFLAQVREAVKSGTYRPVPVRQKAIPKRGGKLRYLGIPTLTDRVVQQALKLIMEPIFEPDQYRSSYAYRAGRRAQDAIAEIVHFVNHGYEWVVEGDIKACFDTIPHGLVIGQVRQRITDRRVIGLCKQFLRAGVLTELGQLERTMTGTPQGGIISPLFANLALTALDRHFETAWQQHAGKSGRGREARKRNGLANYRLIRYSDDFVLMVSGTRAHADQLRAETAELLACLGLTLAAEKTLVTHVNEGFDFLGFRIQRRHQSSRRRPCAYTFISKANLAAVRRKVKALTRRQTHSLPVKQLLCKINPILRGFVNYFRHAAAAIALRNLSKFVFWRLLGWLRGKHHKRGWGWLRRRYFPDWNIRESGVEWFNPARVSVTRYRFRGGDIPTPWTSSRPATEAEDLTRLGRVQEQLIGRA